VAAYDHSFVVMKRVWMVFNAVFIAAQAWLVYRLHSSAGTPRQLNEISNKYEALLAAGAFVLFNLTWRSQIVIGLGCDVTDEGQVDALVDRVMADRGRVDVMVANAGGAFTDSYIPDASIDEFQRTVDLNLTGTYICAQSAARVMIPERCGAIVTLGSIHGFLTSDKRMYEDLPTFKRSGPPYQAAKGGVINLTRGLAAELGEYGITVNCISPGQIPRATTDEGHVERSRQAIPLQRTGVSDDLKGAIALLASPAGAWITGHNLIVDGGWSIW